MNLEKEEFNYSLKNIPIPSDNLYRKVLIEKLESFIKRLRWKVFFFEQKECTDESTKNFGFTSEKSPPQRNDLFPFGRDLYKMVRSIKFKRVLNHFQRCLKEDVKRTSQPTNQTTCISTKLPKTTSG